MLSLCFMYTLVFRQNKDWSTWTITPVPLSWIGMPRSLHASVSHWYTATAVFSSTFASSAASVTGYCRTHQYSSTNHFCQVRFDLEKKLLSLMEIHFLHVGHLHLYPPLWINVFIVFQFILSMLTENIIRCLPVAISYITSLK